MGASLAACDGRIDLGTSILWSARHETGRLVGQPAYTETDGLCGGMGNLLDPGTLPATGILMDKLRFTQDRGDGMPFGALTPLTAGEQECFQKWANGLVTLAGSN